MEFFFLNNINFDHQDGNNVEVEPYWGCVIAKVENNGTFIY